MSTPSSCPYAPSSATQEEVRTAPGPKGAPFVGSAFQFRNNPLAFLADLAREYGDVVSYRVGHREVMLFLNPDHIKEVLAFQHSNFTKWGTLKFLRAFLGNGLLTSEGSLHTSERRLCQPLFFRPEMAEYARTIVEHAREQADSWREGNSIDVAKEMRNRTILILTDLMFGGAIRGHAQALGVALTEIMNLYPRYRPWLPAPRTLRFRAARAVLDEVAAAICSQHSSGGKHNKFLGIFEAAKANGATYDARLVRDEMITFLFAGHETTTHALTWAWYLLARWPEVERKMHDELDSVLAQRLPVWEDAANLPFTRGVFLEALRMYPPVWIMGRRAKRDTVIGGYQVREKTIVVVSPYVTQRDPRWFAEPMNFDPTRWLPENEALRPKFSFIAFSAGPRQCIGEPLARLEGVLLLAVLAQRWRLRPVSDVAIDGSPTATLRPQRPVVMQLLSRSGVA